MRKTITTQTERHIHVCDLCEKQMDGGFWDTCWLCRKDVCFQCRTLMFCGKSDDIVEMPIKVCKSCQAGHEKLAERIQADLDGVNHRLREWLDLWKKAVGP